MLSETPHGKQEAAPSGYAHHQMGEGRPHAQSWSGTEAPAYAETGYPSAAAQFVERSDPPKIRVVVRKRPLNQKVQRASPGDASPAYSPPSAL